MLQIVGIHDLKKLEMLGRKTYKQHFSNIWSAEGLENYLDTHFNAGILAAQLKTDLVRYYIPSYKSQDAGIVKVKLKSQIPAPPFDSGFELEKIYLLKRFTGLGLGKEILSKLTQLAMN